MKANLRIDYDREADILYISKCPPYPEQETEELGEEVLARVNPATGAIESLELLFFSTRLVRDLPVTGNLYLPKLPQPVQPTEGLTLEEVIRQIRESVPEEEWAKLPKDLSMR